MKENERNKKVKINNHAAPLFMPVVPLYCHCDALPKNIATNEMLWGMRC